MTTARCDRNADQELRDMELRAADARNGNAHAAGLIGPHQDRAPTFNPGATRSALFDHVSIRPVVASCDLSVPDAVRVFVFDVGGIAREVLFGRHPLRRASAAILLGNGSENTSPSL